MKLHEELDAVVIPDNVDELPIMDQLAIYWSIITIILWALKKITGSKTDAKIDKLLEFGKKNFGK